MGISYFISLGNQADVFIDLNVKEMDINPLIVNEKGAFAVDVRIVL